MAVRWAMFVFAVIGPAAFAGALAAEPGKGPDAAPDHALVLENRAMTLQIRPTPVPHLGRLIHKAS